MKKILMGCGVLALLAAFGAVGMCLVAGKAVSDAVEEHEAEQEALQEGATPESFRFEHFEMGIVGFEAPSSLGSGAFLEEPSPGAAFIVVRYRINNVSSETRTVLQRVTLVDSEGREFEPATRLTMALVTSDEELDTLAQVMPGLERQQVAAFEVPESAVEGIQVRFDSPMLAEDISYTFPVLLGGE